MRKLNRFTDTAIRSWRVTEKRQIFFDPATTGLVLDMSPKGKKVFKHHYRIEGRERWFRLGEFGLEISLADARQKVLEQRKAIKGKGIDPAKPHADIVTFKSLADSYLTNYAAIHKAPRSFEEDRRNLKKDVFPVLGSLNIFMIKRKNIISLLDGIRSKGYLVHSNRILALVSKVFSYAVDRDILDATPCTKIRRAPENSRTRVLSNQEIKSLWAGLSAKEAKMEKTTATGLKLILLTAQRPGEVRTAEWSEIDIDQKRWEIPGVKTKNRKMHVVPLSDMAIELLKE